MKTAASSTWTRHIPELDGIRGIAILMVLVTHMVVGFTNPPGALDHVPKIIYEIISHGWLGVDLFFVLSGFLITGILVDSKDKDGYFKSFYMRRVLRIMPLYFVVTIVCSLFYTGYGAYFLLSACFAANLDNLFGIARPHGPAVLWSLSVEEHFYLLLPSVVLFLKRRNVAIWALAIFAITPVLRGLAVARGMDPDVVYYYSWFRFDGLSLGALLAILVRSPYMNRQNALRFMGGCLILFVVITAAGLPFGIGKRGVLGAALRYTQVYLVYAAFFALVLANLGKPLVAPLKWGLLQLSGRVSYCLYLIHLSLGDAYEALRDRFHFATPEMLTPFGVVLMRAIVVTAVSYGIAVLSFRYFEAPILRLKSRFKTRPKASLTEANAGGVTVSSRV